MNFNSEKLFNALWPSEGTPSCWNTGRSGLQVNVSNAPPSDDCPRYVRVSVSIKEQPMDLHDAEQLSAFFKDLAYKLREKSGAT